MLGSNVVGVGVCSWVKHKKPSTCRPVIRMSWVGGGRLRVIVVVDEAHYRGSERTRRLLFVGCLGAH